MGTPVDGGIYYRDRNEETKPMVVSEVDKMAKNGRATVAPLDKALQLGILCRVQLADGSKEVGGGQCGVGRQLLVASCFVATCCGEGGTR